MVRFPRSSLKYFGDRERTLNGPSYGCWSGLRTPLRRTKTWVHAWRASGTCSACLGPALRRLESLEGALETIDVKCGM